jgi:hypothetical protein
VAKERSRVTKVERDLSTDENKKFWNQIDKAASRAPTIVGNRLKWPESETRDKDSAPIPAVSRNKRG